MPTPAAPLRRSAVARSLDRALVVVGVGVLGGGGAEIALVADDGVQPLWPQLLFVFVGWIYVGAGLVAWQRRPSNGLGAVMTAGGVAWLAANLATVDNPALIAVGMIVATVPLGVVIHLVLVFPAGRLTSRPSRIAVVAVYIVSTVMQAPDYLFASAVPPYDVLQVVDRPGWAATGDHAQSIAGAVVVLATVVILVGRLRSARPAARRVLAPLFAYGVLAVLAVPLTADVIRPLFHIPPPVSGGIQLAVLAGVPVAFVIGVLRGGFARTGELMELGTMLGESAGRPSLGDALAATLGDPSLTLAFWVPGREVFVDSSGVDVAMPESNSDRAVVDVLVEQRRVGAIVYDGTLIAEPAVVRTAGQVVAIAVDRERLTAELRSSEDEVRRSRSRIVAAGDRARRRLAQDLHDGLQVQLVVLGIEAQELAETRLDPREHRAATSLRMGIDAAAADLRRLVREVMPAALVEQGLSAAAEDLVDRMPVPTRLEMCGVETRMAEVIESTAYFVMAEGLANALKHGRPRHLAIRLDRRDDRLLVEVVDDGIGGAQTSGGGLRGLADRIDGLGGQLRVHSAVGQGTRLVAELPCTW